MDVRSQLSQVIERGAPAQADMATALLERLSADPNEPTALVQAQNLIDAFLHDPYLTKNVDD